MTDLSGAWRKHSYDSNWEQNRWLLTTVRWFLVEATWSFTTVRWCLEWAIVDKSQMTSITSNMTLLTISDDVLQEPDYPRQIFDDVCQEPHDCCQMSDDIWQKPHSSWQMFDDMSHLIVAKRQMMSSRSHMTVAKWRLISGRSHMTQMMSNWSHVILVRSHETVDNSPVFPGSLLPLLTKVRNFHSVLQYLDKLAVPYLMHWLCSCMGGLCAEWLFSGRSANAVSLKTSHSSLSLFTLFLPLLVISLLMPIPANRCLCHLRKVPPHLHG
jgi:hypothetical protein